MIFLFFNLFVEVDYIFFFYPHMPFANGNNNKEALHICPGWQVIRCHNFSTSGYIVVIRNQKWVSNLEIVRTYVLLGMKWLKPTVKPYCCWAIRQNVETIWGRFLRSVYTNHLMSGRLSGNSIYTTSEHDTLNDCIVVYFKFTSTHLGHPDSRVSHIW